MPQIKLVALDLDGTLFNDQKQITPRTRAAIEAALQQGVTVVPATGRAVCGVPEQITAIPGVRYALTSNGAAVVDLQTGQKLVDLPFDAALALRVYDVIEPFGGALSIFIGGKSYTTQQNAAENMALVPPNLRRYFRDTRIEVADMRQTLHEHAHEIEKFSILYPDEDAPKKGNTPSTKNRHQNPPKNSDAPYCLCKSVKTPPTQGTFIDTKNT